MKDTELCKWIIAQRQKIDKMMEDLTKEAGPDKLPIFKKALNINNALVELFWEIMIYREKHSLTPLAYPH